MRKSIIFASFAIIFICIMNLGNAAGYSIGKMKLSASVIDIEQKVITASGKAALSAPNTVIKANSIRIDLGGKSNSFTKGTASGNVVIHAKQIDAKTGTSRVIDATSESAVMVQGENTIVLKGNVNAKITDPEQLSEPAVLNGPASVTIFLNENKIRVEGTDTDQAELIAVPKENKK